MTCSRLLLLALVAGAIAGAAANASLCNPKGIPLAPRDVKIVGNSYDPVKKDAVMKATWVNPTIENSKAGCTDFYTVQRYVNKKMVASDSVTLSNPIASPVSFEWHQPSGQTVSIKVMAKNKAQQSSPAIDGMAPVIAASAPPPQQSRPTPL